MRRATIADYLSLARPDHWIKNVFMIPGFAFAVALGAEVTQSLAWTAPVAVLAVCLIASANYTINEWLDRESDAFHPTKRARASVIADLRPSWVWVQWGLLAVLGLALATMIRVEFFLSAAALLIMGLLYNVRPFRTKDRTYLDVLTEAINNPIRFLLGWYLLEIAILPPSSILLSYWFGGAYLMAVKRFAEYRSIANPAIAGRYRKSFQYYGEGSLLVSALMYAILSSTFLGAFMMKYKIEFIFLVPLIAILFGWYLHLGLRKESVAQAPELLYREVPLWVFVLFIGVVTTLLFFVHVPDLEMLLGMRER